MKSPARRCTCRAPAAAVRCWCCITTSAPPDRLPFYDTLAGSFDVLVPHHPGWGKSERPQWLRHPRDIAAMHSWLLTELGLTRRVAGRAGFRRLDRRRNGEPGADRVPQAGAGRARWASSRPRATSPTRRSCRTSTIRRPASTTQAAFTRVYGDVTTDQLEQWDICREMVFRTAWKPYMYSQTLPHLLGGVRAPALVVWGDDDQHRADQRRRRL